MTRLPRFVPSIALAAAVGLPLIGLQPSFMPTVAAAAAADANTPSDKLRSEVDDFWHYAKIARYDLALTAANKVVADKSTPRQVLAAFEQVAKAHQDDMNEWLLRWQGIDSLNKVTTDLLNTIKKGQFDLRSDQTFIEENINRLSVNSRAYELAMINLRQSGELAYPLMVSYLADPAKQQHQYAIMQAMRDLGRVGLNPLVAATQATDAAVLVPVCQILGQLGYADAVPYLARLAQDQQTPVAAQKAAADALRAMGAKDVSSQNVATLFYDLSEKFYYGKASIQYDNRNPSAYVWKWEGSKGLVKTDVPPAIYNDVMAMRTSADALSANPDLAKAVSLWLASNYKREADLPAGQADPLLPEGSPKAHFYGVSLGSRYVNEALTRALHDNNSQVALRAIQSLRQVAGGSNLFSGGQPIIQALSYPDRQVRFNAAFTLAAALPQKSFQGHTQVVPILAEALAQTTQANVLVVAPADKVSKLTSELTKMEYHAVGASAASDALNQAARLPSVDVIVICDALPADQISSLITNVRQSPRTQATGLVVVNDTGTALNYAQQAVVANPTKITDLKQDIEQARKNTGGLPLDAKTALAYSLQSAELLREIAINRNPVYDLKPAETQLLAALEDQRAEVAQAAGNVLAHIDGQAIQQALVSKSVDAKTAKALKISLLGDLATNAKFFGNHLDASQVESLLAVVTGKGDLDERNAAAEAQGALNLPAQQAKNMILQQAD